MTLQIVKGEIYHVDDEMLAWMDDFEGHPEVYERMSLKVIPTDDKGHGSAVKSTQTGENEEVECLAYFLRKFPEGLLHAKTMASYDHKADQERIYSVE